MKNRRRVLSTFIILVVLLTSSTSLALPAHLVEKLEKGLAEYKREIVLEAGGVTQEDVITAIRNNNVHNMDKAKIMSLGDKHTVVPTYYDTPQQISKAEKLASRIAAEVVNMSDKDKIMYIVQRVSHLLKYKEIDSSIKYSPYAVFGGEGVCQAYSKFAKLIFDELGIENEIVIGYTTETLHMWNAVKVDGHWYGVDLTGADNDKDGTVNWVFVFMTQQDMKNLNLRVTKSNVVITDTPIKNKIGGQGLVSIPEQEYYTRIDGKLVAFPLNDRKSFKTVTTKNVESYYVLGGKLITLSEGKLSINTERDIMSNVKPENIYTNGSGLYVDGRLVYTAQTLPMNRTIYLANEYTLKFKKPGYKTLQVDDRTCIFYDNKFVVEIARR